MTLPAREAPLPGLTAPDGELLSRLRLGVHLMALRDLRDSHAAEDVAQETVVRLLDAMDRRGDTIADVGSFARGIARHLIADERWRQRRRTPIEAIDASVAHAVHEDPLAATVRAEDRRRMAAALATLSADDQELLRALYVAGRTPGELATELGEPPERIRKRKSRALDRLRAAFFGHDSPPIPTSDGTPSRDSP